MLINFKYKLYSCGNVPILIGILLWWSYSLATSKRPLLFSAYLSKATGKFRNHGKRNIFWACRQSGNIKAGTLRKKFMCY